MIVDNAIRNSTGRIPAISGMSMKWLFEAMEELSGNQENGTMPARLPKIKSPKVLLKEGRRESSTAAEDMLEIQVESIITLEFLITERI